MTASLRIFENPLLVEAGQPVQVPRTFRERWIEPFRSPCTVPFEPWVKTKEVIPMVPSRKVYSTPEGLIMHPEVAADLRRQLAEKAKEIPLMWGRLW